MDKQEVERRFSRDFNGHCWKSLGCCYVTECWIQWSGLLFILYS